VRFLLTPISCDDLQYSFYIHEISLSVLLKYKRIGTNSLQENNPNTKKLSTNIHTWKIVFKKRVSFNTTSIFPVYNTPYCACVNSPNFCRKYRQKGEEKLNPIGNRTFSLWVCSLVRESKDTGGVSLKKFFYVCSSISFPPV
jgi:hypothetical protein